MTVSAGTSAGSRLVPWYWRFAAFTAAFLAFTMIGRAVRLALTGRARLPAGPDAVAQPYFLLYRLTGTAAVIAATWLALRFLDHRRLHDVGLGGGVRTAAVALSKGTGLAAAIFAAGFVALVATGDARIVAAAPPWRLLALQAAPAAALVALYEELLFRGYPFQVVAQRFGPRPAIVTFALLFGAVHYPNPGVTIAGASVTALWSALLSVMLVRTRSLWTCVGFHFAGNLVQSAILGSSASGMRFGATALTVEYASTPFAGFPSGLEAAIPTLLAAAVALVLVARRTAWAPDPRAEVLFGRSVAGSP